MISSHTNKQLLFIYSFNVFLSDYRDKFDEFKEVINKANFIAIDCEFTGLSQDRVQQYDSPSEYFQKICQHTR